MAIRLMAMHRKYLMRNLKLRLDMLSKLRHPNLVTLLGHCIDDGGGLQDESTVNRVFLVYEFIPNGNFHDHLSGIHLNRIYIHSNPFSDLKDSMCYCGSYDLQSNCH